MHSISLSQRTHLVLAHLHLFVKNFFQGFSICFLGSHPICLRSSERFAMITKTDRNVNKNLCQIMHKIACPVFVPFSHKCHAYRHLPLLMPYHAKNGRPCGRPSLSTLLSFVLNEAVAAVGSLVHNCKRAVVVFIAESKEACAPAGSSAGSPLRGSSASC